MMWKTSIFLGFLGCSGVRQLDVAVESSEEIGSATIHEEIESETIHWNLCRDEGPAEYSSNLGGHGPDLGTPAEFRIKKIAEWDEQNLDLVVTAVGSYSSWIQREKKGGLGAYVSPSPHLVGQPREEPAGPPCWAIIPIEVKTHTKFNFKWVKSDTSEVVVVENFSMKIVEFDNERDNWDGKGPDREYIVFNTAPATLSPGRRVHESVTDGLRRIESTESGKWNDNPSITGPRGGCSPVGGDPYACLYSYQEERSVKISYTNIGEWELTFGHEVPSNTRGDRVIEFYGSMHPPSCKWVPWKLCEGGGPTAFTSNLAGKGPDVGVQEFRIKAIAVVDAQTLDLVLTVADGESYSSKIQTLKQGGRGAYVSPSPHMKHTDRHEPDGPPCWAVLPIEVNTHTMFNWKLVKTGTSEVQVVEHFKLTVVEFDNEKNNWDGQGPDREYLEFNIAPSKIRKGAKVHESVNDHGIRRVESTEQGVWQDNPTFTGPRDGCTPTSESPYSCLHDYQQERRVDVEYKEIGEWQITFGHTAPKETRGDRVLEFYGSTCELRGR